MSDFVADAAVLSIAPTERDETLERDQLERASRAQAILDDPLIKEAFAKIENAVFQAWQSSDEDQSDHRDRLYLLSRVGKEFRHYFETAIKGGEVVLQRRADASKREERNEPYV